MRVAHEVADEGPIFVDAPGALAVGHACCLHDRGIVTHVVHQAAEPFVQHAERFAQDGVEGGDRRPHDSLRIC